MEISDSNIQVTSLGWSWWMRTRQVERQRVKTVTVRTFLGTGKFLIAVDNGPSITLRTQASSTSRLTESLRVHGDWLGPGA